jgi:hypothetical protein
MGQYVFHMQYVPRYLLYFTRGERLNAPMHRKLHILFPYSYNKCNTILINNKSENRFGELNSYHVFCMQYVRSISYILRDASATCPIHRKLYILFP